MEKRGGSQRGSGVPFDRVMQLPLSGSLRAILEDARTWASEERFDGLLGTGMLLLTLERFGARSSDAGPLYAPRFLHELIRRHAGERFASVAAAFLASHRAPNASSSASKGPAAAAPAAAVSANLWRVFQQAAKLPSHDRILSARQLTVALLMAESTGSGAPLSAASILADAGVDRAAALAEFLRSLATKGYAEEREAWAAIASERGAGAQASEGDAASAANAPNTPPPTVGHGPVISGFHADTPSGRPEDDCLDLQSSVNAIANLIASTQLDSTLSLGVFGNWGSGKSSFMRRLRNEIDAIASLAREDDASSSPAYWSAIAQVEFNAWHYVDANLWASLMSHLLDELRRWDASGKPAADDSPIAKAIEKLEITASAKQAAETRQRAAETAQQEAARALADAKNDYGAAAERLGGLLASSVWSFVDAKIGPERAAAMAALRELGLAVDDAATSAEALFAQVRDVASTSGRLHTIAHQLLRDADGARRLTGWAVAVVAAIAAIVVASIWAEWLRNAAVVVSTAIAGFAAVAGKALAWVQRTAAVAHEKLAPLRRARLSIEQKLAEAETEKAARVAAAEKELAMRRAEVDVAASAAAAREQDLRVAVQAVSDAISGRAVRDFIEQRLAAGDYQKHLGLIATIRRDFEQLSDLIRAHNCNRRKLHGELETIKAALLRARPELEPTTLVGMFQNIGINRVVLYIDDLDRCPSERVVEVLQAIHLLVSFPIFVVVVGVDSRWMAHSLAREYPSLLTREQDGAVAASGPRDDAHAVVTPADYLEKIFQIPFWIPPLRTSSAQKLLRTLTEAPPDAAPFGDAPRSGSSSAADAPDGEPGVEGADGSSDGGLQAIGTTGAGAASSSTPAAASGGAEKPARRETARRPDLLRVGDGEREAMQSLAALIGRSPRATKRFVNSYRLLKVALLAQRPERFDRDSERADHLRAPMFLLAVVTGLPTLAAEYVRMLPDNAAAGAVDQLSALARWAAGSAEHAEACKRIAEFVASDAAKAWQPLCGADLSAWAAVAGQFSFEDLLPDGIGRDHADPRAAPAR